MRLSALSVLLLLFSACAPRLDVETRSQALISDGSNGGTSGFWFLRPIAPSSPPAGTNLIGLAPEVRVQTATGEVLARWTPSADAACGCYAVNVKPREIGLDDGITYRLVVSLDRRVLGFADVTIVGTGAQLKLIDRTSFVGLVENSTLPVKFRIEEAALRSGGPLFAVRNVAELINTKLLATNISLLDYGFTPQLQSTLSITIPSTVRIQGAPVEADLPETMNVGPLLAAMTTLVAANTPEALASANDAQLFALGFEARQLTLTALGASQATAPDTAVDWDAVRTELASLAYDVNRVDCTATHALAASTALNTPLRADAGCTLAALSGSMLTLVELTALREAVTTEEMTQYLDADRRIQDAARNSVYADIAGLVEKMDEIRRSKDAIDDALSALNQELAEVNEKTAVLLQQASVGLLPSVVAAGGLNSASGSFAAVEPAVLDAIAFDISKYGIAPLEIVDPYDPAHVVCADLTAWECIARLQANIDFSGLEAAIAAYVLAFEAFDGSLPECAEADYQCLDFELNLLRDARDSIADVQEVERFRLQQLNDRATKAFAAISELLKRFSETADSIVQNFK